MVKEGIEDMGEGFCGRGPGGKGEGNKDEL